jgi:hypothetical protein
MKGRTETRSVVLRRCSTGHDQDLRGKAGADATQEDEGRHRTIDHRKAAHSTRRELGGGGAQLQGKTQGKIEGRRATVAVMLGIVELQDEQGSGGGAGYRLDTAQVA